MHKKKLKNLAILLIKKDLLSKLEYKNLVSNKLN